MPSSDKVTMTIKCELSKSHAEAVALMKEGPNAVLAAVEDEGEVANLRMKFEEVHQGPNPNFQTVAQVMAALAIQDPDARVEIWQLDPSPNTPPAHQAYDQTEPQYVEAIAPAGEDHRLGIVMVYVK